MLTWQRIKNVGVLLKYATSTYLISELYPKSPILIQDIELTSRQWDIISVFYHLKKPQLIGSLLGIGSKGVEAHIYNIKQKLPFKRKDLSLFLDTCASSIREALQKHYRYLLVEKAFQEMLKTLRSKAGSQRLTYQWIQDKDSPQDFPLSYINSHLVLAGITLSTKDHKPTFILDYQTEFSDPTTYYKSFIKLLEGELQQDKIKDILQDFLKQQEDILSGFSISSDKQPLTQDSSEGSKGSIRKWVKTFLTAPEYNIYRYMGGVILSLLITLLAGFLLPSNASTIIKSQQRITSDGNAVVQGDKNTVSIQNQKSSIQAHHIQKLEQHFYSHAPPQKFQPVRSDLMIPAKSIFLERSDLVHKIHKHLSSQKGISTIVLTGIVGMGGVGKTTLARYYGSSQEDLSVIWELNAESRSSLINSFWSLAYALAQTQEQQQRLDSLRASQDSKLKESLLMQFVKQGLKSNNNWILLYDNLENTAILQDCFPQDTNAWGQGKVIITSRNLNLKNSSYINNQDIIYLGELTPQESQELFVKILYQKPFQELLPSLQEEIHNFLKKIPSFPLDISTAAYYIKDTRISFDEYVNRMILYSQEFEKAQENLLKEVSPYSKTRYGILTLSFDKLINADPVFGELLLFICLLDSQSIPKNLFTLYMDSITVDTFVHQLRKYSLLTSESSATAGSTENSLFSLHRSTQAIGLAYIKQVLKPKIKQMNSISQSFVQYISRVRMQEDYQKMKNLIPHGEKILTSNLLTPTMKGDICSELGGLYYRFNNFIEAQKIFEKSLEYFSYSPKKKSPYMGQALIYYGIVRKQMSDYKEAKEFLEKGIEYYQVNFPQQKDKVAWAQVQLGHIYCELEDYEASKKYIEDGIFFCEKFFPKDKAFIAWAITYLGKTYEEMGKYIEAENFIQKGLNEYILLYPKDHVRVAWVSGELGKIYEKLGKYDQAKILLEKNIRIFTDHFSKSNLVLMWPLRDLAVVYRELGDYKKAKTLLEQSLSICENYYPADHINVRQLEGELGFILGYLNEHNQARTLLEKVFTSFKKYYGNDNNKIAIILRYIGEVYLLEGDMSKAENYLKRASEIFQQNEHPDEYKCLENLASLYVKQRKNPENEERALFFLQSSLKVVQKHFSENSPHNKRLHKKIIQIEENNRL